VAHIARAARIDGGDGKEQGRMQQSTGAIMLAGSAGDCPDIEYATGFRAMDPVLYLRRRRRAVLVVPEMEAGRAERTARGVSVATPRGLGLVGTTRRGLAEWAVALARRERVRAIRVPDSFPHGVARRLQRAGVRVHLLRGAAFPERAVKTPEELRRMAETQQAAVIAMRAAIALIEAASVDADGFLRCRGRRLTSEDVRRAIAKVLFDHTCLCREVIVAGGRQAADPHERGHGPLREREAIVIDIFPQHEGHGYWGDLTRTVVKGAASRALRAMYDAVRSAQSAALAQVRGGVQCRTVHLSAAREFERRGLRTTRRPGGGMGFIHGTGHGVGLAVHEAPSLGLNRQRLRRGNVVTVEPGLYYPDVGGVRIEDTVVVTRGGWRYLAPCEQRFELA